MSENSPPSAISQYLNDNPELLHVDGPVLFRDSTNRLVYVYKGSQLRWQRQLDDNRHRIRAVIVLGHVTEIPNDAFMDCSRLQVVEFQDTSKICRIGSWAFAKCAYLHEIDLSFVRHIDDYAFCECERLRHVTFGKRLESIGEYAFFGCYSLSSAIIPTVRYIKCESFRLCIGLTSVELPEAVSEIGEYAFAGCRQLSHLIMPSTMWCYNQIRDNAFFGCNQISQVDLRLPDKLVPYVGDEIIADTSRITNVFHSTVRHKTDAMRVLLTQFYNLCRRHIKIHLDRMRAAEFSMARIVLLTLGDRFDYMYVKQHFDGGFGLSIVEIVTQQVLSFIKIPDILKFTANGAEGEFCELHDPDEIDSYYY